MEAFIMTVTLRHGELTALTDPHGGELISLKCPDGTEYIWGGDPKYWAGRNPNLFPIVGGLKDGTIHFDGRPYQMGRHGFARNSLFSTAEQGKDYVVFELHEGEETLAQYPYAFRFRVRHQLLSDGFYTQFEVFDPGSTPLPFCVGGHTAFRCPLHPGEQFDDYRLVFDQTEDAHALIPSPQGLLSRDRTEYTLPNTDTIPLTHRTFDRVDTLIFEGLRSRHVSLVGPDGHGVRMGFGDFPMIAFWTKPDADAPYLCLEPWHGCGAFEGEDGNFVHKPHCMVLEPGQEKILRYTVSLF